MMAEDPQGGTIGLTETTTAVTGPPVYGLDLLWMIFIGLLRFFAEAVGLSLRPKPLPVCQSKVMLRSNFVANDVWAKEIFKIYGPFGA